MRSHSTTDSPFTLMHTSAFQGLFTPTLFGKKRLARVDNIFFWLFLAAEVIEDNYTGKLNGTTWDQTSALPLIHSMNHQTIRRGRVRKKEEEIKKEKQENMSAVLKIQIRMGFSS